MVDSIYSILFDLLRLALDSGENQANRVPIHLTSKQWERLFFEAKRQSVLDVVFSAINKLPKDERPPKPILVCWAAHAEATADMNRRMNQEAMRLTEIFHKMGRRTAVLKGAANARLYPDPLSRQCGDIDFWVEGGRKSVESLLLDLKLLPEPEISASQHHIHLPKNADGVVVEVHFRPASGIPFRNEKLQNFLNEEILKSELVPEGFYSPTIKFALVMQLSHLQQHFFSKGLGLRQYMDYFVLLQHSTDIDRSEVAAVIKSLCMGKACAAVMWLLGEVFGLERERMLCAPDAWRGKKLLNLAFKGGNFGQHDLNRSKHNVFVRWFNDRLRTLRWLPFDPVNIFIKELKYWRLTLSLIPLRIKRRRIAL